jgi:hypothetical protein
MAEYERLLSSTSRLTFRLESIPGWRHGMPDDAGVTFTLHDANAGDQLVARFAVLVDKDNEIIDGINVGRPKNVRRVPWNVLDDGFFNAFAQGGVRDRDQRICTNPSTYIDELKGEKDATAEALARAETGLMIMFDPLRQASDPLDPNFNQSKVNELEANITKLKAHESWMQQNLMSAEKQSFWDPSLFDLRRQQMCASPVLNRPWMQHTVQITLADGRFVNCMSNTGYQGQWGKLQPTRAGGRVSEIDIMIGEVTPPTTQLMDRCGTPVAVTPIMPTSYWCDCIHDDCVKPWWCLKKYARVNDLRKVALARDTATMMEHSSVELFQPCQPSVVLYDLSHVCCCIVTEGVSPCLLGCCTHSPPVVQGVRVAGGGAVLPGRVRTVWQTPDGCCPLGRIHRGACVPPPHGRGASRGHGQSWPVHDVRRMPLKEIEFQEGALSRLRVDVITMVAAMAAQDMVCGFRHGHHLLR